MAREPMFNADQVQKMKDAYVMGNSSLAKIGADFGVSVPTVAKYLRSVGVDLRGRGRPKGSKNVPKRVAVPEAVVVNEPDQIGTGQAEVTNYDPPEVDDSDCQKDPTAGTDPVNTTPFRW